MMKISKRDKMKTSPTNYYATFRSVKVRGTDSSSEEGAWNKLRSILPDQYSKKILEKQGYKVKRGDKE